MKHEWLSKIVLDRKKPQSLVADESKTCVQQGYWDVRKVNVMAAKSSLEETSLLHEY